MRDAEKNAEELRLGKMIATGAIRPAIDPSDRSWTAWPGLQMPSDTAEQIIWLDLDERGDGYVGH